mmetsp:Transcript_128705/g.412297  ORF Transcript_128705/g.412297 Transcript_128705/m.412297 type:complete len:202 (+) Transcript_128705:847-1452(+)
MILEGELPPIICLKESTSYSFMPMFFSASSKAMPICCCIVQYPKPTLRRRNSMVGGFTPFIIGRYSSRGDTSVFTKSGRRRSCPCTKCCSPFAARPSNFNGLGSMTKPSSTTRGKEETGAEPMASSAADSSSSLVRLALEGGPPNKYLFLILRLGCTTWREIRTTSCRNGEAPRSPWGTAKTCRKTVPFRKNASGRSRASR